MEQLLCSSEEAWFILASSLHRNPTIFKGTTFKNKWKHFVNSDLENLEKGKALVKEEDGEGLLGPSSR